MSIVRDIRLVAAQNLSLSSSCRAAFLDLLNELDMELDREGYEPNESVKKALKRFENELMDIEDVRAIANEEDIFGTEEFIDIEDLDLIDPTTEED